MLDDEEYKKKALNDQMWRSFRSWRYRFNEKISQYPTIEEATQKCLKGLTRRGGRAALSNMR